MYLILGLYLEERNDYNRKYQKIIICFLIYIITLSAFCYAAPAQEENNSISIDSIKLDLLKVTRQEFVTIASKMSGYIKPQPGLRYFADVTEENPVSIREKYICYRQVWGILY